MNWKRNPAQKWKLYAIIDDSVIKKRSPERIARSLYKSGVSVIQLRYKNHPSYKFVRLAKKIQDLASKYKKALLINDRLDVALSSNALGVHLGNGDMSAGIAHALLGPRSIVGKTVHSTCEAKNSRRDKLSYVSAGPIFGTPLKKTLKKRGIQFIKEVKKTVQVPVFAIGGINAKNVKNVLKSGASGICVARAITEVIKMRVGFIPREVGSNIRHRDRKRPLSN